MPLAVRACSPWTLPIASPLPQGTRRSLAARFPSAIYPVHARSVSLLSLIPSAPAARTCCRKKRAGPLRLFSRPSPGPPPSRTHHTYPRVTPHRHHMPHVGKDSLHISSRRCPANSSALVHTDLAPWTVLADVFHPPIPLRPVDSPV